jgi:hypothetical protein
MSSRAIQGLRVALILGIGLSDPGPAGATVGTSDIPIFRAVIDDSARAKLVQHRLEHHGRKFVVYELKMNDLDEAVVCAIGCETTDTYTIDRSITGTEKWIGLQLGNLLYFDGIADDLRFEALPDRINRQQGTTATEFLQMAVAEQIKGLLHDGGNLVDVNDTLSMTYVFGARERVVVMAPTALHFAKGALSDEGDELEKSVTADIFSKHAFLAKMINDDQRISMAGEMYLHIEPRAGVPRDRIFSDGRLDLGKIYDRKTAVIDIDRVDIELVVKNDSGTYQPDGAGIVAFAWTLMKALKVDRVGFETYGDASRSGVVENQGHSTWEEFRAANPALVDR